MLGVVVSCAFVGAFVVYLAVQTFAFVHKKKHPLDVVLPFGYPG